MYRLKEKYSSVSRYYILNLESKNAIVSCVTYRIDEGINERFNKHYFLKTNRLDLNATEIKELYDTLTVIGDSFRSLKTKLNLRPNFHRKGDRIDAHIFIAVIAYRLLNSIRHKLKPDFNISFRRLSALMQTHVLATSSFTAKDKKRIHITSCSKPEQFHKEIYKALGIKEVLLERKIISI